MSEHAEEGQQASPALSETRLQDCIITLENAPVRFERLAGRFEGCNDAAISAGRREPHELSVDEARAFAHDTRAAVEDVLAEVRRLQSALASAREETAQAVRVEPDADLIAFAAWMLRCSHGVDLPEQARMLVEDFVRSRSLPGEKADA